MNEQASQRQFASPCVVAAPKTVPPKASEVVAIPATNTGHAQSGITTVGSNGLVQQIIVRCTCDREHKIRLDYSTPGEENSNG